MPGRSLTPVIQSIPVAGATLQMILPSNVSLVGVSVFPLEVAPRTLTNLYLDILESEVRTAIRLGQGVAWCTEATEFFGFSWHGDLPLGPDFQYRLNAFIPNYAPTAITWMLTAFVDDQEDGA